ncbi:hypothetical protein C8J57DRAFT_1501440 [Mycena rebaudengoi]|nr:hypothetical protein C8J57DRAFT_1501440 [Mycena rebaudengoi]
MFALKFLAINACLLTLSEAAPLPVSSKSEGRFTDANGYRCTQHYIVRPEDSCDSIGRSFSLPLASLVNMNPELGEECAELHSLIGQELCVQTVISGNLGRDFVLNTDIYGARY